MARLSFLGWSGLLGRCTVDVVLEFMIMNADTCWEDRN